MKFGDLNLSPTIGFSAGQNIRIVTLFFPQGLLLLDNVEISYNKLYINFQNMWANLHAKASYLKDQNRYFCQNLCLKR